MVTAYRATQYRQQDVVGASPIRLVVMAYDLAIRSCDRKDFQTAAKAVGALRDALDYDYPDASMGLLRLYQWILARLRQGDFDTAKSTLSELREAWSTVEKQLNTSSTQIITTVSENRAV